MADARSSPDTSPEETPDEAPASSLHVPRRWIHGSGAFASSMLFHVGMLLAVGADHSAGKDTAGVDAALNDADAAGGRGRTAGSCRTRLDENVTPSLNNAVAISHSDAVDVGGGGQVQGSIAPPTVEQVVTGIKSNINAEINIDAPLFDTPESEVLIAEVPAGMLGDPREVVDNYQEAMDRITREMLMLLEKRKVLVVWAFDQSESMKDDQKEIRGPHRTRLYGARPVRPRRRGRVAHGRHQLRRRLPRSHREADRHASI